MRALIRGTEICLENAWSKWQKMNMLFLTGKEKDADGNPLPGDGWTLVEDYQEPVEGSEEPVEGYDERGRQQERTRCTAVYVGHENTPEADRLKEIEELKRKLAALESDL